MDSTAHEHRTYEAAPRTLPMLVKATLPAVPGLNRLPGIGPKGQTAPDLTVSRPGVRVDRDRLADYAGVCAFPLADPLPSTYAHIVAFPLQLALLTDAAFPFSPMGAVHVANSITQHRPLRIEEQLDLLVHATDLRPHPKGQLIDVVTTASVGDETVWEETMTLLRRESGNRRAADSVPLRDLEPPRGPTTWRLSGRLGRRYAAVSGDRNPIHLYPLTARAFGFARPIVHGMWTKARSLAALHGRLPAAYTVQVAFRRPIPLPTTVRFGSRSDDGRTEFGVTRERDGSPYLVGVVTPR